MALCHARSLKRLRESERECGLTPVECLQSPKSREHSTHEGIITSKRDVDIIMYTCEGVNLFMKDSK